MSRVIKYAAILCIAGITLAAAACSTNPRVMVADESSGFDQPKLAALLEDAADAPVNLHGLIIARRGMIVAELYRDGWNTDLSAGGILGRWSKQDGDTVHDVRSITKSIVALAAGSVLARHPEYGVGSKIRDFPELAAKAPTWAQELELRHFLTMSSGLAWKEWGRGTFTSDETALAWKKDPVGYALRRPLATESGSVFNYSGGSTVIASRMLELMDGRSIEEIIGADLFGPLGIVSWNRGRGPNGHFQPHAGIGLSSRDMLKLGELVRAQGLWNGARIVPEAWIEEMTAPVLKVPTDLFDLDDQGTTYGYFWWTGTAAARGEKIRWEAAVGNGGQKIFVVPGLDLVVVMTGGDYGKARMQLWETGFLKRLLEAIAE